MNEKEQIAAFYRQLWERIGALTGVRAAGAIPRLPLAGERSTSSLTIEGRPPTFVGKGGSAALCG